jgi:hypothetical protein
VSVTPTKQSTDDRQNQYCLDPKEQAVIDGIDRQIADLAQQRNGALMFLARVHGLNGNLAYESGVLKVQE